MRYILVGIGAILLASAWGCGDIKTRHDPNAGYEKQKQEGVNYHQQNIQRLITRDPGQDPRK